MSLCACSVHADGESGQPSFLEPHDDLPGEEGCCARRERHTHSARTRVADQLKQIRPLDRIASRENEDRNLHRGNLVDQARALICAQFHRVAVGLRGSAAMHAGQIAGLGYFPDRDERPLVEIDRVELRVHESSRPQAAGGTQ